MPEKNEPSGAPDKSSATPEAHIERAAWVPFHACLGDVLRVPFGSLATDEGRFQVRGGFEANGYAVKMQQESLSRALIANLSKALETAQELDPLTVLPIEGEEGLAYVVVNGHHRFRAYQAAGRAPTDLIPVRVFKGSDAEALLYALQENGRDTLNMTAAERAQAAWGLLCCDPQLFDGLSQRDIARELMVSQPTVQRMLKKRAQLLRGAAGGAGGAEGKLNPESLPPWRGDAGHRAFNDEAWSKMEQLSRQRQGKLIAELEQRYGARMARGDRDLTEAFKDWLMSHRHAPAMQELSQALGSSEGEDEF